MFDTLVAHNAGAAAAAAAVWRAEQQQQQRQAHLKPSATLKPQTSRKIT
jgi:hypothetical protein